MWHLYTPDLKAWWGSLRQAARLHASSMSPLMWDYVVLACLVCIFPCDGTNYNWYALELDAFRSCCICYRKKYLLVGYCVPMQNTSQNHANGFIHVLLGIVVCLFELVLFMSCYKNGIFIINVDLHSGSSINAGLA
jgi:hypothetical protein